MGDTSLDSWMDEDAPVDADDCAVGLVVTRPSPGDDITREAFGAMDGYRQSNDSSDGGTP